MFPAQMFLEAWKVNVLASCMHCAPALLLRLLLIASTCFSSIPITSHSVFTMFSFFNVL